VKLGILGGTFNPIHNGHIQMANYAIKNYQLDDVFILPSGQPPHKNKIELINAYERYEMCLLAAMHYDNIMVESLEIERSGKTYTFDTLSQLRKQYDINSQIYYIVGGDTLLKLHSWKMAKEVFKMTTFIAFLRKGYNNKEIITQSDLLKKEYNANILLDYSEILDVSSTEIRKKISQNISISNLVSKEVEQYIYEHKIYR